MRILVMELSELVGQTLDGKYQMTRELGHGGMGTVYLATHLGTERPVAVKVIAPQYMERTEFVERFRREARAAGRLRHPNVVNVTDFGFSDTKGGQVAYLVMEYLDGCTLGEILDEEKNLPVGWTLDILEQVCSAVHEAHTQGIIHRDLKPDNIWLEPNQRGGYTVKVLDFGIAKLEEHEMAAIGGVPAAFRTASPTFGSDVHTTLGGIARDETHVDGRRADTGVAQAVTVAATGEHEAATLLVDSSGSESETAIFDEGDLFGGVQEKVETKIISERRLSSGNSSTMQGTTGRSLYDSTGSAELTRVGAVLGTPLYMSPEQCRGEHLDARSDIYSLGVIAYQMLSGKPPFEGDFQDVMESHKSIEPAPLKAKRVRKKLKRTIHSALNKDPELRPQTAEAFASKLRSRSEGIGDLLRRALVIESEHLPKFLLLTTFFSLPMIALTLALVAVSFLKVSDLISESSGNFVLGLTGFGLTVASAFCTNLIIGCISWIVAQYLAVPLRPIRLRPALGEARRKWRRFAGAGIAAAFLPFIICGLAAAVGFLAFAAVLGILYPLTGSVGAIIVAGLAGAAILGLITFFATYIHLILVAPIVMMENVRIVEALKRSRDLVKRSLATAAAAVFIMFLIPAILAGAISFVVNISAQALDPKPPTAAETAKRADDPTTGSAGDTQPAVESKPEWNWRLGGSGARRTSSEKPDMRERIKHTLLESLIQVLWLPIQILVFSFSGIIVALLYLKTRMAGGESMNDLIERFEDDGRPRKKWQERVRQRLIQSGRVSSNPSR
ncbi:MAG TPA: protein kinase [Pyrinomonadaceae bacterium]|nr:protein kinase [Pyrinomonadaceae bacterium]